MKYLIRFALLIVVVVAAVGFAPQTERAEAAISCDVLHVSGTVVNLDPNPVYRLNGSGPGLPTAAVSVPTNVATTVSWVIYGPGTWTGLYLEWMSDLTGGAWVGSNFSPTASCSATGCAASVPIPSTAVGGTITDNAAVFGDPDPAAMTDTVLEVGKTFWMDGLDSSGMYRKVLVSCQWVWVEAAKTGPNYDDVWNGTPLPGHTVD